MAIERTLYFANSTAYCLADTKMWMDEMKSRMLAAFPDETYNTIYSFLEDMKWMVFVLDTELIPDVCTNVLIPIDIWFLKYGVRVPRQLDFSGDTASIGTYSCTDSDFRLSDNSVISEDLDHRDDDSTLTLLTIYLSDLSEHDWEIMASDDEDERMDDM